jgi:hypothetical protein
MGDGWVICRGCKNYEFGAQGTFPGLDLFLYVILISQFIGMKNLLDS